MIWKLSTGQLTDVVYSYAGRVMCHIYDHSMMNRALQQVVKGKGGILFSVTWCVSHNGTLASTAVFIIAAAALERIYTAKEVGANKKTGQGGLE